jgi:hypothetical protein
VLRVELGQVGGDGVAHVGQQDRVEPEVRVAVAQRGDVGGVQDPALGVLRDGLVDRRLEPVLHDDQVGTSESDGAGERRLEIVRLDPRLGQAHHVDAVPADALGHPGQWVEAGGHLHPPVVGRLGRAASEWQHQQQPQQPTHENHSQFR